MSISQYIYSWYKMHCIWPLFIGLDTLKPRAMVTRLKNNIMTNNHKKPPQVIHGEVIGKRILRVMESHGHPLIQ